MRIEHTTDINASVDRVWALTTDIESWPAVTPTMSSVTRLDDGALRVGSSAKVKQPGQPERVWTVTELEPGKRFAWQAKVMKATMTGTHELIATPDGVTNHLTVDLSGPGSGLIGRLSRRQIAKAIATENEGFKRAAEQPASSAA
jgi:uncharacterized membrane protein